MRRPGRLVGAAAPTMPVAAPRAEAVAAPQERWAGPGRSVLHSVFSSFGHQIDDQCWNISLANHYRIQT